MRELINKNQELFKYLIFGVLTTLVNILCFFILDKFNIDIYINNTISWIVSVIFAFITFGARIFSYFVDMGTIYLLYDGLRIDKLISKIVSNVIVIIINYIFSKFIFRNKGGNV